MIVMEVSLNSWRRAGKGLALTALMALGVSGCDSGDDDAPRVGSSEQVRISGNLADFYSGFPLEGVVVEALVSEDDGFKTLQEATSNGDGGFAMELDPSKPDVLIRVTTEGYHPVARRFPSTGPASGIELNLRLLPFAIPTQGQSLEETVYVDPATSNPLVVVGASILADGEDTLYEGTYRLRAEAIDPSGEASMVPGGFDYFNILTSQLSELLTIGLVDVWVESEDGEGLHPVGGHEMDVWIPVAEAARNLKLPEVLELSYYDAERSAWVNGQVVGQLVDWDPVTIGLQPAYFARVPESGLWMASIPVESQVAVTGCVRDQGGSPAPFAQVVADSRGYVGRTSVFADATGNFELPLRPNTRFLIRAEQQRMSQTRAVFTAGGTSLGDCLVLGDQNSASIRLTWGSAPQDLDAHLLVAAEGGYQHVFYGNPTVNDNGTLITLDVDDTSNFGPELINVPAFNRAGVYPYLVHRFSAGDILQSQARVELSLNGTMNTFDIASVIGSEPNRWWHVFNLVVAEDGAVTVEPVNRLIAAMDDWVSSPAPTVSTLSTSWIQSTLPAKERQPD